MGLGGSKTSYKGFLKKDYCIINNENLFWLLKNSVENSYKSWIEYKVYKKLHVWCE